MSWTQNDGAPAGVFTCSSKDPTSGVVTAANLTGATVVMHVKRPAGGTVLSRTVGGSGLTVVSAAAGTIQYVPQAGDLPSAGVYEFEFQVTYASGPSPQTFRGVRQSVDSEIA